MSLDFQPCTNHLRCGSWPDLICPRGKWFFSQTGLSILPRYIPGHAATEQFHAFQQVCTDVASDYSPDCISPSFPLFTFQIVLLAVCECDVTPPITWCFFCGGVRCESVSLNIPVSSSVDALRVLTPVQVDSISLKGLKQITKCSTQLLGV